MTDMPDDIMKTAREMARRILHPTELERLASLLTPEDRIARALLAERERFALYLEQRNGEIQDRQEIATEIRRGGDAS